MSLANPNHPPYVLIDTLRNAVAAVQTKLGLQFLNYQYGNVNEVNAMLADYNKTNEFKVQKFPMIWVVTGFTMQSTNYRTFATIPDLRIFVINQSNKTDSTVQRIEKNFKPILYPICEELLNQIAATKVFTENLASKIQYSARDYYFFSTDANKATVLIDVVDCIQLFPMKLTIKNNINCPQ